MRTFKLFRLALGLGIRNLLVYRLSAILTLSFSLLLLAGEVVTVDIYYRMGNTIGDWTEGAFFILLGSLNIMTILYTVLFEIAHDELVYKVKYGLLDFDLVRPVDTQLLTSLNRVDFAALASLPVPIGIVVYGLSLESITPSLIQMAAYLFLLAMGCFAVYLVNQLAVALCFWFTDSGNITAASDQLVQMGARPLNLYPRLIRYGIAYIIPITLCSTLSATTLTEGFSPLPPLIAILSLAFLFAVARLQWNIGLRRYTSASS